MRSTPPQDDPDFDPEYISKSEQKRAMERLQQIGTDLAQLPAGSLKKLPISETLLDALLLMKTLKGHEAVRRHKQLIGKLMRHEDENTLLQALNERHQPHLERQLALTADRLLTHGEAAMGEVLRRYEAADRHTLRQFLRAAQFEAAQHPEEQKARQKLLGYLREVVRLSTT